MSTAVRLLDAALAPASVLDCDIHSSLEGSIEQLSFLRKSLLFAELSELSYLSRAEAGLLCNQIGLPEIRFYDREGAQAYIFGNDTDVVVTCRGTEPNDWNDIRADLSLGKVMAETVGKVHRGFKTEVDDLWPRLEQALVNNTRTAWFAGHSLGAAMATICAGRCKVSQIRTDPRAVFTYGSPRVGNRRYVNYLNIELYRWVNNNDIVTRVPPTWLDYSHKGQEVYLDAYGQIRRLCRWQRTKDRWRGFVRDLKKGEFDFLSDHSIRKYVAHIHELVLEEKAVKQYVRPLRSADDVPDILPFGRPTGPATDERQAPTPWLDKRRAA
jgi:triacylglycerol lipase